MSLTVKQLAELSGVSVRTLHFYDELGLFEPAYYGPNGYRYYEEAQVLTLQQILFYRELGFELKTIKTVLCQSDFDKIAALESHRRILRRNLAKTRRWLKQFWTPNAESYAGHSQLIVDSDLRKAYETYHPRLPEFVAAAIKVFAAEQLS